MKKIYLVSYFFAPLGRAEGVARTHFAKYLHEAGWDVTVITGDKYRSFEMNLQADDSLLKMLPSSIEIKRFKSDQGWLQYDIKKTLRLRPNLRTSWIDDAMANFEIKEDGVIYSFALPAENAVLAHRLAQKYKLPLVLHYFDDFFEDDPEIVKEAIHHADAIIAITPQIKRNLEQFYGYNNVRMIANGYADFLEFPQKPVVDHPIRIAYAGSFTFRTRPEIFARACQRLIKQNPGLAKNLEVDFFGPDGYYFWLFLRPYLGASVRYKGYLPFNDLMAALTGYDMALATVKGDISFVSKVYHYLNAGLPVFAICENAGLKEFILKNQIGIVVPLKIDEIVEQLKNLLEQKNQILAWRENVLKIRDQYALKNSVLKISDILNNLS